MSYEQTIIIGNVGRDAEMRYTPSGAPVCSFSVAVSTRWTDKQTNEKKEKTNWYNVSFWNRQAETAAQYVKKGTQIMVIGTVTARAYMANDGQAKASLELRGDNFQLLGSRGQGEGGEGGMNGSDDYDSPAPRGGGNPGMDDIPF
jgi:single-strand DNA-binding protein